MEAALGCSGGTPPGPALALKRKPRELSTVSVLVSLGTQPHHSLCVCGPASLGSALISPEFNGQWRLINVSWHLAGAE